MADGAGLPLTSAWSAWNPLALPLGLQDMLELTVLALINQIANVGFGPLVATRVLAANPSSVRALVTDTATADRVVARVPALARPGVQLLPMRSLRLVHVDVRIRGRDAVRLTWTLTPRSGTTEVDLAAQAHSRGLAVRVALLLGGRRLIARRLDSVLSDVAARALHAAEDLHDTTANAGHAQPAREIAAARARLAARTDSRDPR